MSTVFPTPSTKATVLISKPDAPVVALPTDVDGANAKAEFKDGVLHIHLPKTAGAKTKTIEVKVA